MDHTSESGQPGPGPVRPGRPSPAPGQSTPEIDSAIARIFESTTDAFFALDPEWRFTYVNGGAERLLGFTRSELTGKVVWDVFPEAVDSTFDKEYRRAVAQQVKVDFEEYYPPFDRWFEVHAYPSPAGLSVYFRDINERKRADAEQERLLAQLAAERAQLEAVLREMPAGVMIAEAPSGQLLMGNEQLEQIFRHPFRPANNIEEYNVYRAFHPGGIAIKPEEWPLARAIKNGEVVEAEELEILRGDGTLGVVRLGAAPIRDPEGRIVAAAATFYDITEQRQREDAERFLNDVSILLAGSLDYETTLQRVARLAVARFADMCMIDALEEDGSIRRVASAHVNPAKEGLARSLQELYPPDPNGEHSVPVALRTGRPVLVTEISPEYLASIARSEGHARIMRELNYRSYMVVPMSARGRTFGTISFVSTESDRRYGPADLAFAEDLARHASLAVDNARLYNEAREAARMEQQRALQLLELAQASLVINSASTPQEVLQIVTNQAREIVGAQMAVSSLTSEQDWSQSINTVSLSDKYAAWRDYSDRPNGSGIYTLVCQTNKPMRLTQAELEAHPRWKGFGNAAAQHPPLNGWLAAPLIGLDGRNLGLVQLSDKNEGEFTEQDEAILVQLTQVASVAIENTRLYGETQEAVRARDELLSIVSHDLKNPLGAIKGYVQLMQRRVAREGSAVDTAKLLDGLHQVDTAATKMARLINELLDMARLQAGQPLDLVMANTDLVALASQVAAEYEQRSERHPIRVEAEKSEIIGEWDATRLERVLNNLISNALKYSPQGGEIVIRLGTEDADGRRMAWLSISDQGIGIPADDLPHIFDWFRRGSNVTGRIGGTGVGLSSARLIVEQHGGRIDAESAQGAGSTFTIRLPAAGVAQPNTQG